MEEKWLYVDYPTIIPNHYMVSNYGQIKNIIKNKTLKGNNPANNGGYITVALKCVDGNIRKFLLHRLIIGTFYGFNNDLEVNHINAIKIDNNITNLEYTTRLENAHHAASHNLYQCGASRHNAILNDELVHSICTMLSEGLAPSEIIPILNLERSDITIKSIRDIMKNVTWKHITKDYNWDIHKIKYKRYSYDDLISICLYIRDTDNTSAEIARNFANYDFKRLKNIIKKIRQGKLYQDIFKIVMGSSTIESITENELSAKK